ncbi:MAG: arylsulfatase [Flavobacteriaceae bacterium]|nr:arylsulfatase [Flavobacteriaceae bacterium]
MKKRTFMTLISMSLLIMSATFAQKKPNILVFWGDDVGMWNISAYHNGMMGGTTPNIDRIANEGALFTDAYAQQSCTAGRASFIMGQHPFRTGLLTIGMPGAKAGINAADPTIAELLKPMGYATGQFGKNHLGDRDEHLPTVHGFDEFYGNLYHLNAEEEPESYYYPKDPEFHKKFGPRGVLHTYADGKGGQKIEDTGPLTIERMRNADTEFIDAALKFMNTAVNDNKPFFIWLNSTRTHVWTHLDPKWEGSTGYGLYADGMNELDHGVGRVLDELDRLGIADNTIIVFSTDNGAEKFTFPDGGTIPFRGEKGTTWEGGFRIPQMVRWPGHIQPGTVINDIFSQEDWLPTLLAAAGNANVKDDLLKGKSFSGKNFKAHIDGYNQLPLLKGEVEKGNGPRHEIIYFDAAGNLNALRYNDWKVHFAIMEGSIAEAYRKSPSWPIILNLRNDPFEVSMDSGLYIRDYADQMWMMVPAQTYVSKFLETFKDFPPRSGDALGIDKVLMDMQTSGGARN